MTAPISYPGIPLSSGSEAEGEPSPMMVASQAVGGFVGGLMKKTGLFGKLFAGASDYSASSATPQSPLIGKVYSEDDLQVGVEVAPLGNAAAAQALPSIGPNDPKWTKDNFLKRISEDDRYYILERIEEVESMIPDKTSILQINPNSQIFYGESTAYIMHHYLEGNIDKFQASRLLLYETCRQHVKDPDAPPPAVHNLVGEQRQKSFELLKQGFQDFFSEADWQRLEETLKQYPQEPWDFFTVEYPILPTELEALEASKQKSIDIYSLGKHILKFPTGFIQHADPKTVTALGIPPRLWTLILESRFGEHSMLPDLVLGHSSIERLSNTKSRVVGVPCCFIDPPRTIHDIIKIDPLTYYAHDLLYHLLVESANIDRAAWTEIALRLKHSDPKLFVLLIDRNFPLYAKPKLLADLLGRNPTHEEIFYYSLPYFEREGHANFSKEQRAAIMKAIIENRQFLRFDVSAASLEACVRREPADGLDDASLKPWLEAVINIEKELAEKAAEAREVAESSDESENEEPMDPEVMELCLAELCREHGI